MASAGSAVESTLYLPEVELALKTLLELAAEKSPRQGELDFHLLEWGDEVKSFPVDDDQPTTDDIADYVVKIMEFVQTFLVANRLNKESKRENMWPTGFTPTRYVTAILDVVGRNTQKPEQRRIRELRYYPQPHLQTEVDVPFVDFAGFLVVMLIDYLRWAGGKGDKVVQAARLEIDEAIKFIVNPDTYIEDSSGIGWGFVPQKSCNQRRLELRQHRHILPTSWAITAIQRYLTLSDSDPGVKEQADRLFPKVLDWVKVLRTDSGYFRSSESRGPTNLAGHNYVTELLLAFSDSEHSVPGAEKLAIEALDRFLDALDEPSTLELFEMNISYPVFLTNRAVQYADKTTWATCLSTLSLGAGLLTTRQGQEGGTERVARARVHCATMARQILARRNERNIWQKTAFQFHWNLNAVEALLRTGKYARQEAVETSVDAIIQAVDFLLQDNKFQDALRTALVSAIRKTSVTSASLLDISATNGEYQG